MNFTTKTQEESMFFDHWQAPFSTNTTVTVGTLLDTLLSSTGILATNDTYAKPIWIGTAQRWTSRIHISHMEVRVHVINSQSNALVAGDMFNTVRWMAFVTPSSYASGVPNILIDTIRQPITNNIAKILCDETFATHVAAFDSSDLASPTHEVRSFSCPVNLMIDCITNNTRTTWDTKAGNLALNIVSDSSVTPHPQITYSIRTHFKFMRTG